MVASIYFEVDENFQSFRNIQTIIIQKFIYLGFQIISHHRISMERSNQNKLKHSKSNQIRGMIVSHKSPDRSSIGNVNNPHQYTLHGIQLSMSRKVQNSHANNHENSQSQHRHVKHIRDLSGSKELKSKKLKNKKTSKVTKRLGESQSRSKNKNSRQKSSSQDSRQFVQKNNNGKFGKIDQQYYSNAKIQLTQNRNKHLHHQNQKKKMKKVVSTDFLKTSDRLRTPKSRKKMEEEETNKLKFDSMKGVISFEGKLIKIKPFESTTRTKEYDASNDFFSEYISGEFASPYKKRISNSKQKKSENRSFKSRKRLTNQKNEKRSHPKQSSSEKDLKYKKQKKSKSNEHHRTNISRKKNNETQKHSSKGIKTGNETNMKNPKGGFIRSTKDSRVNEEEEQTLKYTQKKYERKQIIDFEELKKQIEEQKVRSDLTNIENFAKCIFKAKMNKIKECANESSRVTVQESVSQLIQEYDLRAKCINMISHISGSLGLKQNIFALAVSLFDHYSAILLVQKSQDLGKEDAKVAEDSKSLTLSDQRKITALTCILLSLKLQNSESASLFLSQLGSIFHKLKKHRDYQLPATHQFIIQKEEIQHERTSTHEIIIEKRSGEKSSSKNRKRSKSRYTTTYSTGAANEKPNKKAELQKKRREFEQRKKQITEAKFEGLYRILNEQIQGILKKEEILEREKQIYWKLNKKIYKKTYVYWIDSLTASWDQYILTLKTDTNSIKNSLSTYGPNISSFKNTNMCPKTPEFLMLFRSQYSPQKIWQVIQILQSSLYHPEQFYSFNPAFLVLSTMYMLIRINLEYQQTQQAHNRAHKSQRYEEQILKVFENYRKLLVKSSNVLFVDSVNVNLLFGEYLMKLQLQMGDILACCQFISHFFYPSPLYFNKQSYERSFINHEHFQLLYGQEFESKQKQGYSHYDERLSYHAHNPELYAFFGRTVTR